MSDTEQTSLEKLQKIDLDIAKEFASICDHYGLTYYMLGGTMLGAIRHKGFIPWDDDMDFAMFRSDYEKFLSIAPRVLSPNLKLVTFKNTPNHQYYCSRIVDTDTKIQDERIENENGNTYASIDVFPIDGTPNAALLRRIYYFRVLFHRALMSMCYKDMIDRKRKRGSVEKGLIFILGKLPIDKFTTAHKEMFKIDRIMRKQKVDGSKYIGNLMGAYRTKEVVPAWFYGKGRMYPFEDTEFRGLNMYDEYLKWQYGDYMKLPSQEDIDRKTHYRILELHGEKVE